MFGFNKVEVNAKLMTTKEITTICVLLFSLFLVKVKAAAVLFKDSKKNVFKTKWVNYKQNVSICQQSAMQQTASSVSISNPLLST